MIIDKSLKAVFNHRIDGCDSYTLDLTVGCDHNCVYCHFSDYQKTLYKKIDRSYKGQTLVLSIEDLLKQEDLPAKVYLSFSTDPFATKIRDTAHVVIEHLLKRGTELLIITKGIIPDRTIELLDQYAKLVSIEIGITNLDEKRRRMIEPGTPQIFERLKVLEKLNQTNIPYVTARMDPIFPVIDDNDDNIRSTLKAFADVKTKNVAISYIIASGRTLNNMQDISYLKESLSLITEVTPTAATKNTMSVPLDYKLERLGAFRNVAEQYGMKVHTCACKDSRLKKLDPSYSCHPVYDNKDYLKNPEKEKAS